MTQQEIDYEVGLIREQLTENALANPQPPVGIVTFLFLVDGTCVVAGRAIADQVDEISLALMVQRYNGALLEGNNVTDH